MEYYEDPLAPEDKYLDIFFDEEISGATVISQKQFPKFDPENDDGNIEYKRELIKVALANFDSKTAQMEWRLYEGRGESIYFIGIDDDGSPFGLTKRNMAESLFTLKKMATVLHFTLTVTTLWTVIKNGESLYICKCKVKGRKSSFNNIHNVNIKVIGLSNSGKSSLICCLKSPDVYDDGDGSARTAVMSHDYEFESGNTASVKLVPIYFNEDGCIISSHLIGDSNLSLTPKVDEKDPYKVTYLHDNPGYLRYTRTSFNGLCRVNSVIDMIVIDINANPDQIIDSLELFCFSYYLGHRPIVVLNKSDTKTKSKDTICCKIKKLTEVYMSKRICTVVHSIREADAVAESFNVSKKYIPIFEVSCVTRGNLHLIHRFLFKLAPESFFKKKLTLEQTLFSINSLIKSDKGLIVEGDMLGGKITATSNLKIGPMNDSSFLEVKALSIMRNSESINSIEKQQNGAICLEIDRKYWPSIRKGMVIVEREKDLRVFKAFSSKVILMKESKPIKLNQEIFLTIGNIQQTAIVNSLTNLATHPLTIYNINFILAYRPEYLTTNTRFIFKDELRKGVGIILDVK